MELVGEDKNSFVLLNLFLFLKCFAVLVGLVVLLRSFISLMMKCYDDQIIM